MKTTQRRLAAAIAAMAVVGGARAAAALPLERPAPAIQRPPDAPTRAENASGGGGAFPAPTGPLTLRDALAAALANHPGLAGYAWELRAREAEAIQAGARPNPELGIEIENWAGRGGLRGFNGSESTIGLSQRIELGGKRVKRVAIAGAGRSLAARDYEIARLDVVSRTTKMFLEVLAAQEQLALAVELEAVAEDVRAAVARRVRAGAASPVEESRAAVDLVTGRLDRERAEHDLAVARTRLAAAWGGTRPAFSEAAGDLGSLPAPPSAPDARTRSDPVPDLARWAAEAQLRRAALDLERAGGAPDLSVGAGVRYFHDSGEAAFVLELDLPLPVLDRNRAGSRAAAMRVLRAEEERRAAAVDIQTRLARARRELSSAESEAAALRDRALPEAETAFRSARDAYLRGSARLTEVLDAERLLYRLKSRYIDALLRHRTAIVDVERLDGGLSADFPPNPERLRP